jgi:hypothetical protein
LKASRTYGRRNPKVHQFRAFLEGGPLERRALRTSALAAVAVYAVALSAGAVRLLPWLVAPDVPFRVSLEFAKVLAATASEASLLLGIPIGCALSTAAFVELGEARALFALGATPWRLTVKSSPRIIAFACLLGFVSAVGHTPGREGALVSRLIEQARTTCSVASEAHGVALPTLGLSWLCFPGSAPRLVGSVPRSRGSVWFAAGSVATAADPGGFTLENLQLVTRESHEGTREIRVQAKRAHISGLLPWRSPARAPALLRMALLLASGVVSAALLAHGMLRMGFSNRLLAALFASASSLPALGVLHGLERKGAAPATYLLVPATSCLAAAIVLILHAGWARFRRN